MATPPKRDLRQSFAAQARMARARFLDLLKDGTATQASLLLQCIAPNAQTAFGKEHGFEGIRDVDAYRAAVPIRHYDELSPWIDRAADGEGRVLTTEDPLRFWKTTGTTAKSKKIPITPTAAARVSESFMVLQGTQLLYCPELNERSDTILHPHLSPRPVKEWLGGRFPYCTTTEAPIEVGRAQAAMLPPWLLPLQDVAEDDAERLYFVLCYAALHDLYAVGCLHPSRFQTVVSVLSAQWPRLVRELHEGTVLGKAVRDGRPERARELEALANRRGTLLPRDVWPSLRLVTSWSGSYISRYLPVMEEGYSSRFLAMPSISSECFMTMTVDEDRIGQPLNVRGGFFEFLPSGETVEASSRTLLASELQEGESYEIVLTTAGGLYRYAMCDIFRVTGFVERMPRLEYIGRRAVSDLTGEKLAEEQVSVSVKRVLEELGLGSSNFTLCAIQDAAVGKRPRYVLVLEPPAGARDLDPSALASRLDETFGAVNSRYEMKRSFSDLDPVAVEIVESGTFTRYRELLVRRGMPAGQLKERVMHAVGGPVLSDLLSLRQAAR